jgi:hypothetical protein
MLKQLFKGILNIVFLRGGPQELPYSPLALICLIVGGILIAFVASGKHVVLLISNMAFMLAMVWGLLYLLKKQDRYIQTLIALVSCGWVMSLLFLIFWYGMLLLTAVSGHLKGVSMSNLTAIFSLEIKKDTLPVTVDIILMLGILGLLVWKFLIDIFIIRQATEWRVLRAIGFILLLNIVPALVQKNFIEPQMTPKTAVVKPISTPSTTPSNIIPLNK